MRKWWLAVLFIGALVGLVTTSEGKLVLVNLLALGGQYQMQSDIAYGDNPYQHLDLYLPPANMPRAPFTLVFVPGGCWGACGTYPKEYYLFVGETFASQGYPVAILNYRQFPLFKFDAIVSDVASAVSYLTEHGPSLGMPGSDLVLTGHSAGAHLAAMVALNERYLTAETRAHLRGWIGFAGPYNFLPFTEDYQPELFAPEEHYPDSQPVNFVSADDPPALLLYGNADETVKPRNILSLSRLLMQKGVPVQARCYDGIDHTGIIGALSRPLRNREPVLADVLAFLRQLEQGKVVADSAPLNCPSVPPAS